MTNNEKLQEALRLIQEVSENVQEYSTVHSATRSAISALRCIPESSFRK